MTQRVIGKSKSRRLQHNESVWEYTFPATQFRLFVGLRDKDAIAIVTRRDPGGDVLLAKLAQIQTQQKVRNNAYNDRYRR
jgi:hypothetical protein